MHLNGGSAYGWPRCASQRLPANTIKTPVRPSTAVSNVWALISTYVYLAMDSHNKKLTAHIGADAALRRWTETVYKIYSDLQRFTNRKLNILRALRSLRAIHQIDLRFTRKFKSSYTGIACIIKREGVTHHPKDPSFFSKIL